MSKVLVMGDIHGRTIWKDIVELEAPDKVIFLGDYVSSHGNEVDGKTQLSNLYDILEYKEENSEKVVLLRGNHDIQHLGYHWAECCSRNDEVMGEMIKEPLKSRFIKDTQWVYISDNTIFSHAGVTKTWLKNSNFKLEELANAEIDERFGFTPDNFYDYSGTSVTQPCVWVRPLALAEDYLEGYDYFVGHTPVSKNIFNMKDSIEKVDVNIYLCDALGVGQYVIINDGEVEVKTCEK